MLNISFLQHIPEGIAHRLSFDQCTVSKTDIDTGVNGCFCTLTVLDSSQVGIEELIDPQKIAKRKTPILRSKGTFANLGKAEEWAKKNLQGKSFTNKFTKEDVLISGSSIKEMLNK